ncbi:iron complex outermembrane receptor protein [Chitinophaga dinghuensis]|uniref:Iron complex outermembrane receptor protein n=1 Tax=Chitinophaga dinghuensis TaxID=1539050 RepID=A0A327VZM3_9BACT|nr:TonB-dependent receptor [Chitinophaga dinghuensis]RAJ81932.1 iron complex outermembrane receptor protein [Chitinophaga dinghuensis]
MKQIYLFLSFILLSITAFGQTGAIKGTITSSDGQPAPYVTIGLKDTRKGTLTNEDGTFHLKNIKQGHYTLIISYTGTKTLYKEVDVVAEKTVEFNGSLEASASQLNEVVVDGKRGNTINKRQVNIGKLPIANMDLPQAVTVVGHKVIEEQQAQRLSDVVKNVNGIYMASTRAGTQESFNSRGYQFSSTNTFKNGARINPGAMPEMSSLERVEVLKGSAAILYGNVAPGAVMNMVTKQPKFNWGGEVNLRAGSFGLFKPAFDVYGPLSQNVAFRVNGTFETADSYRDQVHSKRYYVNPSFLFKLGKRTELLVQGDYLKHDFTPDFGIGSIADTAIIKVPRNTFYGAPWQYAHTQQTTASANLRHQISNNWNLSALVSYSKYQRDYFAIERIQAKADSTWERPLGRNANNEDYYSAQVDFTGKVKTGRIEHTILAGADADRYYSGNYNSYGISTQYKTSGSTVYYDKINVYNPNAFPRATYIPTDTLKAVTVSPINRVGIYVQDLISISEKVKVLAGVRFSYLQTESPVTYNFINGSKTTTRGRYDNAFSPKLGIVYKPRPNTALFASYTSSFTPNTGNDIYGNPLPASIIEQVEAGVKNDFFDGLLSVNVTAYRIKNNNYAQTAPFDSTGKQNNNSAFKALIGGTLSQGVELDIAGHPIKGMDVIAGYSYNNMTIDNAPANNGSVKGERLVGNPNHTANASIFYTIQESKLKGLKFGAGFYYIGQRYAGWNNTTDSKGQIAANRLISVPGFSTLDISAGYTIKKISVMAKVSNLTNTYNYYVHENYSINPIPPTQFVGTVSYRF